MNERLQQFLNAENISQSQFADTIGVARASVSHILAGRNKPGFDFIESTSRHYPTLNLDWLIMGTGKMYKSPQPSNPLPEPPAAIPQTGTLMLEEPEEDFETPEPVRNTPLRQIQVSAPSPKATTSIAKLQTAENKRNIKKIVVFYDDNTFQEIV
ncbi:MAG: helix-turn-helix domain-containing protein [Bacteroidales bacterium]|nr:helix-turn-helix domain-containing protein [Bacteroidales bacterium]